MLLSPQVAGARAKLEAASVLKVRFFGTPSMIGHCTFTEFQESLSLQKREEASLEEKETELKKRLKEKGSDHLLASSNGDFGGCKQHKA